MDQPELKVWRKNSVRNYSPVLSKTCWLWCYSIGSLTTNSPKSFSSEGSEKPACQALQQVSKHSASLWNITFIPQVATAQETVYQKSCHTLVLPPTCLLLDNIYRTMLVRGAKIIFGQLGSLPRQGKNKQKSLKTNHNQTSTQRTGKKIPTKHRPSNKNNKRNHTWYHNSFLPSDPTPEFAPLLQITTS